VSNWGPLPSASQISEKDPGERNPLQKKKGGCGTCTLKSVEARHARPKSAQVNAAGIDFYNAVINQLLAHGIQPHLTLYHWDFPQVLQDKYGGWLSDQSIPDFAAYAAACFSAFGDRVIHWTTFNEMASFLPGGWAMGTNPPGPYLK
jgi:beta-glucosidase/6-phospho-beta-glucosidase/beta-galactosidase